MKKLLWPFLLLLLLLSSCTIVKEPAQGAYGTLALTLSFTEMAARTIVPPLDTHVAYYSVTGLGPGSAMFSHPGASSTIVIETALVPGAWTIVVDAFNTDGYLVGSGSTEVSIEAGQVNEAAVAVTPLDGTGTLTMRISWPPGAIGAPSVSAKLTAAGAGGQTLSVTVGTTSAACESGQTLHAGYYSMTLQLLDGGVLKWGCFEAVRILADQTTSAAFNLTAGDLSMSGTNITIAPDMQDPIAVDLAGQQSLVAPGTDTTVTATTSEPVDSYQWYLNGAILPGRTGPSITIGSGLGEGTYRLDLQVTKANIVSSGSYTFTVAGEQVLTWDLAADFRASPGAQNPGPDRYGNANVWHYMTNATATFDRDGDYLPLTTFRTGELGMHQVGTPLFQEWKCFEDTPWVGKNTSDSTLYTLFEIPAGALLFHPHSDRNVVIGWRSPIEGEVSVEGGLESIDHGTNGVTWNIDKNSSPADPGPMASGEIENFGQQDFLSGAGGNSLQKVGVKPGDMIYLVVGPRGDHHFDTTRVVLRIRSNSPAVGR